ncbi:SPI-1 type III secretion system chaperone SpaK, partial [Salmonella enterica subsp. enterica serovar Infantis]|nr:SPI-1 type III secretion system chaperone SpaK [Salmonella enterica]EGT0339293.1 SPI-1 type III secretion system chaperone SpaK [Salmonella enterica subsp. enterica serovar Infantis]EAT5125054.1 SPI-1 type III secretion system chaperone SpaK [Salmonella enterica]EKN7304418.1 SPI-1 type III secretion system chaperone SpaK [Salmonella enterica subsp. enterica serovar Infantis]EKO0183127.1 SPI-1 type III secretion system chaperone SpaK [Salmonella enterica subsp. enterica serovar Infantis]
LKALVHPDFLSDGEKFSTALNGFYNYLEVFSRSLMR